MAPDLPVLPGMLPLLLVRVASPPAPRPRRKRLRPCTEGGYAREDAAAQIAAGRRAELVDLAAIAAGVHQRAAQDLPFPHAEHLALSEGFLVERDCTGASCALSGLVPHTLMVARAKEQAWNLRVFHELAHALLANKEHTHGDVWILTLMLAVPAGSVKHTDVAEHVPKWALAKRRKIAREMARGA